MNQWWVRLNKLTTILLVIFVLWGFWNNYEKTKLNQTYKNLAEQLKDAIEMYEDVTLSDQFHQE